MPLGKAKKTATKAVASYGNMQSGSANIQKSSKMVKPKKRKAMSPTY